MNSENRRIRKISILGFQCIAMSIEGCLKEIISYLVYSHIWLNLPQGDHHFLFIFLLCMDDGGCYHPRPFWDFSMDIYHLGYINF
jgi:hypothetical protein